MSDDPMAAEPFCFRDRRPRRFVMIGVPGGRRVELFQAALARQHLPPALIVPWLDVIRGKADLRQILRPEDVLRIDSPGKDWEVERALLLQGAPGAPGATMADDGRYAAADATTVRGLDFERGRILWPRQWYLGFRRVLLRIAGQLSEAAAPRILIGDPTDTLVMFDKRHCHQRLSARGVAVPQGLREPASHAQLIDAMGESGCRRVFVKLAHGSSASGVVAYQTHGRHQLATTTVEVVRGSGGGGGGGGATRLYNSRRIRTYSDPADIATLFDELCRHRVHVERWLPKAGIGGRSFDLRVVVIGGAAAHVVVRTSRSPMTNLHLLNERGDVAAVRERVGEVAWAQAMNECERAMTCFPNSLHGGIDLLIGTDYRRRAVLEVNAYGDLLPGITWRGLDTYEAQVRMVVGGCEPGPRPSVAEVA